MEDLLRILGEIRPDVEFEGSTGLLDNGDLDSYDVVSLVGELNSYYCIDIPVEAIVPENFNSPGAILALVERLVEESNF